MFINIIISRLPLNYFCKSAVSDYTARAVARLRLIF